MAHIQPLQHDTKPSASPLIARLNARIADVLTPHLPSTPFALVDFPDHANIGDSSIWLGTLSHFGRAGLGPAYVCTIETFDAEALIAAVPDGPIFIQGGGNFGDLWPENQNFRIRLLRRFPGRRIIQLPQSIHFNDRANIAETSRAIAAHGNVVMFIRDHASAALAAKYFECEIHLCPDMAFCLGPLPRRAPPSHKFLHLLRQDRESRFHPQPETTPPADTLVTDWPIETPKFFDWFQRAANAEIVAGRIRTLAEVTAWLAVIRHIRGVKTLCLGRHVVTDRLHGHILCTLLGIPHTILDNNYGKLTRFTETWSTRQSP
jgi:pyruvyl transferase EpsO